jgi:hypothetical protein
MGQGAGVMSNEWLGRAVPGSRVVRGLNRQVDEHC